MPINSLYHTWFQRIQELRPNQRIPQVRNFVCLMTGIYQSRSVCLSRVAGPLTPDQMSQINLVLEKV